MMKRFAKIVVTLLVLAIMTVIVMVSLPPVVADAATYGNLTYTVSNGEVTITDCSTSASGALEIPAAIGGYPVTSIGSSAFDYCTSLTSITIPDSVQSIGYSAFSNCTSLTSVTIPDSVTSIGSDAFYNCSGLTSITIPDSVTSIGSSAFYYCTGLTSITIPASVTSIGSFAFYNCTSLSSITIPASVTSIGSFAFCGCTGLVHVLYTGTQLQWENVDISYNNDTLDTFRHYEVSGDSEGWITKQSNCTIEGIYCALCEKYIEQHTIEGGAHTYVDGKCSDCGIPSGMTYIFNDGTATITGYSNAEWEVVLPATIEGTPVTSIDWNAFYNCTSLTSVTIPDSVTSIGSSAFYGCTGLTSITIPDSVTSIGSSAFYGCTGLTSITIPDSVTSIGGSAFNGCSGLTSITIPDSVTSISRYAFYNCTGLTSITIPDSVTSIDVYAFSRCTGLTGIWVNANNLNYSSDKFGVLFNKDKTTLIQAPGKHCGAYTIPDSVTSIGGYAFYGCTGLTSVTIPDSVQSIDEYAFYNCTGLTSVTIPDSVQSIGSDAFYRCTGLATVSIGKGITSIGSNAFCYCFALQDVFYAGTEQGWSSINMTTGNDPLLQANVVYNSRVDAGVSAQLSYIMLDRLPDKTVYAEGEQLDLTGLSLQAVLTDGASYPITASYSVSGYRSTPGTHTVEISYREKTVSFLVTVQAKELAQLVLAQQPFKTQYVLGEALDLTGMVVLATYSDGTQESVTDYTVSGDTAVAGVRTVYVSAKGRTVAFTITVQERTLTGISIAAYPAKVAYIENESLSTEGLVVMATYNDGKTVEITDYELVGFSSNPGTHTLSVVYGGWVESFEITVAAKALTKLVVTSPAKQSYLPMEEFDATGMVVTACYNNGQQFVVDDFVMTGFDSTTVGTKTITVTYGGLSSSFAVSVAERSEIQTDGSFTVSNKEARLGEYVVVPVTVSKNTGIAGLVHTLSFDASNLKFVSAEFCGDYVSGTMVLNEEKLAEGKLTLLWFSDYDVVSDGVVYNLTFEVLETAADGVTDVKIEFQNNGNANISGENVIFDANDGSVEVKSYWLGDLNGDRLYKMVDIVMLAQYVAGCEMELTAKQLLSADVNEDTVVDIHDVVLLNQWLLEQDI